MKIKEIIFLASILVFLALSGFFIFYSVGSTSEVEKVSSQEVLNVLFVLDKNGEALSTNFLLHYPQNNRVAMIDIPKNTGLILQSLKRTDGIGEIYNEKGLAAYTQEVSRFLGVDIPFQICITIEDFAYFVDMLGGISLFIPNSIEYKTEENLYLLPSGLVTLDGDKILQYLLYENENEAPVDSALRKQKAILAFLQACNENSELFFSKTFFNSSVSKKIQYNLRTADFKKLLSYLVKTDTERIVPQRLSGTIKTTADGKKLLFPTNNGEQIKEVVKQTLSSLASDEGTILERVYAIEILNGTDRVGLAKNTAEIFQNFGYDVTNFANASEPHEETIIIDRIGNTAVAQVIADMILCENIESTALTLDEFAGTESAVDFTVILGSDFDGRVVRKKN
ncbi:MAG: LCP family protein [Spirochaetaceae bacterium]|nr:LCP family protein [Spirochaetaceae bacterium]